MSVFSLLQTLTSLAEHVGKTREDAQELYWDKDLNLNKYESHGPLRPLPSATPKSTRSKTTRDHGRLVNDLLAACEDEEQRKEAQRAIDLIRMKSAPNWEKFLELTAKIAQNEDLKSNMAAFFESKIEKRPDVHFLKSEDGHRTPSSKSVQSTKERLMMEDTPAVRRNETDYSFATLHLSDLTAVDWLQDNDEDFKVFEDMFSPSDKFGSIGKFTVRQQEELVLEDLILLLLGKAGEYVNTVYKPGFEVSEYEIDPTLDEMLANKVKGFIPLLQNLSIVQKFADIKWSLNEKWGRVRQGMGGCFRQMVYEFRHALCDFDAGSPGETQVMNLSSLWSFVQQAKVSFELLAGVTKAVIGVDLRGGQILSYLCQTDLLNVDDKAGRTMRRVQQAAFEPFLKMLECWIYRGIVDDPNGEFFVVENHQDENPTSILYAEAYWKSRFVINQPMVPSFLRGSHAEMVLNTGKYLNVFRICGQMYKCPHESRIQFHESSDERYLRAIKEAHDYASRSLIEFLIKEHSLMEILGVVKHYFLMDKADFMEEFMALCDVELGGCIGEANLTRLNTLLELAMGNSLGGNEEHADAITGELKQYGLEAEMRRIMSISTVDEKECEAVLSSMSVPVWEAYTLSFKVKWPISIVLQARSLTCYQMLFRHFFHLKRVKRILVRVRCVSDRKLGVDKFHLKLSRIVHALRNKMSHFVQTLQHCITFDVIEPSWEKFEAKMQKARSMDQVLFYHTEFTDACLGDCMLTSPDLLHILRGILDVCLQFCAFVEKSGSVGASRNPEAIELTIKQFDSQFCLGVLELMRTVSDETGMKFSDSLKSIMWRLNYNDFYISGD